MLQWRVRCWGWRAGGFWPQRIGLGMFLSRVSRMKYSKYPNQTAHLDLKQSVSTKNGSLVRLPFFVAKMV